MPIVPPQKKKRSTSKQVETMSQSKIYSSIYKNLVRDPMQPSFRVSDPKAAGPHAVPKNSMALSSKAASPYNSYVSKLNKLLDKNDP